MVGQSADKFHWNRFKITPTIYKDPKYIIIPYKDSWPIKKLKFIINSILLNNKLRHSGTGMVSYYLGMIPLLELCTRWYKLYSYIKVKVFAFAIF